MNRATHGRVVFDSYFHIMLQREAGTGTEAETVEECFSSDCSSVSFLISPRTTWPRTAPPSVDWDHPHQWLIKKIPDGLVHRQSTYPSKCVCMWTHMGDSCSHLESYEAIASRVLTESTWKAEMKIRNGGQKRQSLYRYQLTVSSTLRQNYIVYVSQKSKKHWRNRS